MGQTDSHAINEVTLSHSKHSLILTDNDVAQLKHSVYPVIIILAFTVGAVCGTI